MPSTTTKAGLPYPLLTDTPDVPRDVKALAESAEAHLGAPSFTSTTRPTTGLYAGRLIYETDTTRTLRFNGSAWETIAQRALLPYAVTWLNGAGGAALALGAGTLTGVYSQVGELVTYEVRLTRGADTNLGSTGYAFTLPVTPSTYLSAHGYGSILKGGASFPFTVVGAGGDTVVLILPGTSTTAGTRVSNSAPGTWGTGDAIYFSGTYKAAAAV